jgi:hypothetical protein
MTILLALPTRQEARWPEALPSAGAGRKARKVRKRRQCAAVGAIVNHLSPLLTPSPTSQNNSHKTYPRPLHAGARCAYLATREEHRLELGSCGGGGVPDCQLHQLSLGEHVWGACASRTTAGSDRLLCTGSPFNSRNRCARGSWYQRFEKGAHPRCTCGAVELHPSSYKRIGVALPPRLFAFFYLRLRLRLRGAGRRRVALLLGSRRLPKGGAGRRSRAPCSWLDAPRLPASSVLRHRRPA